MRILVDARGLLEEFRAGVEGYTWQMLINLKRMYPEDEYILFSYSWKKQPDREISRCFEWIHKKWPNKLASLSWRFLQWPKADRYCRDIDWVWYPNIRFMPVSKGIKKVVTVHDLSFELLPECYRIQSKWWHWYMNIKNNIKNAELVLAVSKTTARDVEEVYGIDKNKVKWHHLGVELVESKINIRNKYGLTSKYFLHVGTLEKRKNVLSLIEAYILWLNMQTKKGFSKDSLPDMVLVGGRGWSMNNNLWEIIRMEKKIRYLGFVDEMDKESLISSAMALFYVSFYEGFGFPPLEAIRLGVPVISSFAGSLGEVLEDKVLMVDSLSLTQIVGAMEMVYQDNFREKVFGRNKYVEDNFKWEKTAEFFRQNLVEFEN